MAPTALQRMRQPVLATDHNGRWARYLKWYLNPKKTKGLAAFIH